MRAVAILGPDVSPKYLSLFSHPGCSIIGHVRGQPLEPADAALVFGGDGTIHHYLSDLARLQIPVLLVPLGSGNDFARGLGLRNENQALSVWQLFLEGKGNVREIDLGAIACAGEPFNPPRLFCNIGGAGLDAEANRRANAMPRWLRGSGGYLLAALGAVKTFSATRFIVHAQLLGGVEKQVEEPGLLVAFANGPTYGAGFRIAPKADFSDGLLDVCFVRRIGKARLLRLIPRVFRGTHLSLPEVEYFKASALRLETETPLDVYADGEFVCRTPVEVRVQQRAMRVIAP